MSTPVKNGQVARALYRSIRDGQAIENIPGLLKQIIQEEMWKSLVVEATGEVVEFLSFAEFVKAAPPEGLGASLETIERLCRDDSEAMDLLTQATKRQSGGNNNPNGLGGKSGKTKEIIDNVYIINIVNNRPTGTTKQAGLRRLSKLESEGNEQAANLRRRVLSNELSVNAALIELKLRPKSITLPLDPKKAAATIRRHFSTDDIEALIEELQ